MPLLNIEDVWLDKFKAAHLPERDLAELQPQHIDISNVAIVNVAGTDRFKGDVVAVQGSPIKFRAVDQVWNIAKLSSIIMAGAIAESDPTIFTNNVSKDLYTAPGYLVLRLETLTGVGGDDLTAVKDLLTTLTDYDFNAMGGIVHAEGVWGLSQVSISDALGGIEATGLATENFTHVYSLRLCNKIFSGETMYVVGGNGITMLAAADMGDIVTQQVP